MAQNHTLFGAPLLTAIATGGTVSQPKPWLGLLKQMPAADGSGAVEADYAEYVRIDATGKGFGGNNYIGNPTTEAGTGDDAGKMISVVKSQEEIHWPECRTAAMNGKIVGWGLYGAKTGGNPRIWGEFPKNDDGTVGREVPKESIPMFREEDFKLKVK